MNRNPANEKTIGAGSTKPEGEMREAVLVTAIRLFRDVGYHKTTVADIAKALRMSPANIYRFFESKKAIHESAARFLMGEVETAARTIANGAEPATERLRTLLATVHHMNAARYVEDSKIHEMVAVAMEESWDVCEAHILQITLYIAQVIGDGAAAGLFHVADVEVAAKCVSGAMLRFFHPHMIAQFNHKPGATLHDMIAFVIAGLTPQPTA